MSKFDASMDRDANYQVIGGDFPFRTKRIITFAGATTDAWGDDGGALDGGVVFSVTGMCAVQLAARCTTSLTGAGATVEVGISGATAIFLPIETATDIDAGQIWLNDAANTTYGIIGEEQAAADNLPIYMLNGDDIILTVKTANVETGVLEFFARWMPWSDDASIVATTT